MVASGRHGVLGWSLPTLKVDGGNLHVLSCYAPNFTASRAEKDSFFACLQDALLSFPSNECFVTSMLVWAPEL